MLDYIFGVAQFMPHSVCMLQRPDLVATHAIADLGIAAAYFAIPAAIWRFVRAREDLDASHRRLALLFAGFITMCALTHLLGLVVLWQPLYGAQALLKIATAAISLTTAFVVWPLIPALVRLPSPSQLQRANDALAREMVAKEAALVELATSNERLERTVAERTRTLADLNRRFETSLAGSNIVVFEQDEELRYTWLYNAPKAADGGEMLGRTDADMFPPEIAAELAEMKTSVLATGARVRHEIKMPVEGGERWFRLDVMPIEGNGIIATATDVTEAKSSESKLTLLMRELAHRTKNLLAVVAAIARQTGRANDTIEDFQTAFLHRLTGLGATLDLLVRNDWEPVELGDLVRSQLSQQTEANEGRFGVAGPRVALSGAAAQTIGLALHELTTNALKYGALSVQEGTVDITWEHVARADAPWVRFTWAERDGPEVTTVPDRSGFGTFLTTQAVAGALQGNVDRRFERTGLRWTIEFPLPAATANDPSFDAAVNDLRPARDFPTGAAAGASLA